MKKLTLKTVLLIYPKLYSNGFTLTESLVSMIMLSITLTVMLPAFMNLGMENADKRIMSSAIALSNNLLDNLRRSPITAVPLGKTTTTQEYPASSGYYYRVNRYICLDLTIYQGNPICGTANNNNNNPSPSRDILIRIEKGSSPYEEVYSIQTVFSSLR